eukprot:2671160-Pyramimonas_sp.AAC.1
MKTWNLGQIKAAKPLFRRFTAGEFDSPEIIRGRFRFGVVVARALAATGAGGVARAKQTNRVRVA